MESSELSSLLEPDNIKEKQRVAEKEMSAYTTDEWKYLRLRAKNDIFFLCYGILGYKKLSTGLHGHLSEWLQRTEIRQFREILLPRGHFKSTLCTITDSIQIALPDDSGVAEWPRNLGTNCRVLLGHETVESAARFLNSITGHFLGNPILMGLFPECVPNPKQHRINKNELELPRTEIWSEPTFDTIGVGGRSQGRHYNFLKLDDLFGDKARDSATERQTTLDWFDNIQSFFSTFAKDHLDLIGTRWSFNDLYAHAHEMYGELLVKYIRGCEEVVKLSNGEEKRVTIFPEEFPIEKLAVLKKNRKVWTAQYANDPKEGATGFQANWKKFYHWVGENRVSTFGGKVVNVRTETDNVILVDPALNGLTGYVITGMNNADQVFIIEATKKTLSPPELVDKIFKDVVRWQPRLVVVEAVLFSEVYQHWITREMSIRGIRFKIEPGKTRQRAKYARVAGLANYFAAGQILFNELQIDLIEEYDNFGATDNYHLLDALAYGPEFWKRGGFNFYATADSAMQKVSGRDNITGYSNI